MDSIKNTFTEDEISIEQWGDYSNSHYCDTDAHLFMLYHSLWLAFLALVTLLIYAQLILAG